MIKETKPDLKHLFPESDLTETVPSGLISHVYLSASSQHQGCSQSWAHDWDHEDIFAKDPRWQK